MSSVTEGKITIPLVPPKTVSKEMEVFYNPVMKLNRDISLNVIQSLANSFKRPIIIGMPLEGTGVRAARVLKELDTKNIESIHVNDISPTAVEFMKKLIKSNKCDEKKIEYHNKEATLFLLESRGFDYLDIDPFGCPNQFLDAACKRIHINGILAVTATDTSALTGTYPAATKRKYDATITRTPMMHEFSLRLLIRKVQVVAAQYERAAIPVLSYAKDHYVRIYFRVEKGKSAVDKLLAKHKQVLYNEKTGEWQVNDNNNLSASNHSIMLGPMFCGDLHEDKFLKTLESHSLIDAIKEENKISVVGFYSIPFFAKMFKWEMKPLDRYLKALDGVRPHCDLQAVKTKKSYKDAIAALKKVSNK